MRGCGNQQRRQVQFVLFRSEAVQLNQQIGTTNQVYQLAYAQLSHDFAGFLSNELEVVHYALRQAVIMVATQFFVLSCNTAGNP